MSIKTIEITITTTMTTKPKLEIMNRKKKTF